MSEYNGYNRQCRSYILYRLKAFIQYIIGYILKGKKEKRGKGGMRGIKGIKSTQFIVN